MYELPAIVAASSASIALRWAAAFFLVLVAIGLVYALVRLGRTLGEAEVMLNDVNTEVVPLLKQATETLDNINAELVKVDAVMTTVVDVTEKVDSTTRAVESAVSVPAKKAAAWGAGVSQAVSSLFGRGGADEPVSDWGADAAAWRRETPPSAGEQPAPAGDPGDAGGGADTAGAPPASPETDAGAAPASAAADAPAGGPGGPLS